MTTTLQLPLPQLLDIPDGTDALRLGDAGDNTLQGAAGSQILVGYEGDDYLYDTDGYNMLLGGSGNDAIIGRGMINAGLGDDNIVAGGDGTYNVYHYRKGDGRDTISLVGDQPSADGSGILLFDAGIHPASLSLVRQQNDLLINIDPTDQIRLRDWFSGPQHQLRHIAFDGGPIWSRNEIAAMNIVIHGTDGADELTGGDENNVIHGGAGNDYLLDADGNNHLYGGDGDDSIIGRGIIIGGKGNDEIVASGYAKENIYRYAKGDGHDTISVIGDQSSAAGNDLLEPGSGVLELGEGILTSSVSLVRHEVNLVINMGLDDQITLYDWFSGPEYRLRQIAFKDGPIWDQEDIARMNIAVLGTDDSDELLGGDENNLIHGGAGNDYLIDAAGDNLLHGGDGNDVMLGIGIFDGGRGDDIIQAWGDATENVYFFDEGDGRDTLYAKGEANSSEALGTVGFGDPLLPERLWLQRDADDLKINVLGSCDDLTIKNWYQGESHRVARFVAGDDRFLDSPRVDALVQAMAQHTPPSAGWSDMSTPMPDSLHAALAAAWRTPVRQ